MSRAAVLLIVAFLALGLIAPPASALVMTDDSAAGTTPAGGSLVLDDELLGADGGSNLLPMIGAYEGPDAGELGEDGLPVLPYYVPTISGPITDSMLYGASGGPGNMEPMVVPAVPEPSTALLLLGGLGALVHTKKRKRS